MGKEMDFENNQKSHTSGGIKVGLDVETNSVGDRREVFYDSSVQKQFTEEAATLKEYFTEKGMTSELKDYIDAEKDRADIPEAVSINVFAKNYISDLKAGNIIDVNALSNNPKYSAMVEQKANDAFIDMAKNVGLESKDEKFYDSKGNEIDSRVSIFASLINEQNDEKTYNVEKKDDITVITDKTDGGDRTVFSMPINADTKTEDIAKALANVVDNEKIELSAENFGDLIKDKVYDKLNQDVDIKEAARDSIDGNELKSLEAMSHKLDNHIDSVRTKADSIDNELKKNDRVVGLSSRNTFRSGDNLGIMVRCKALGIQYQGKYVTNTDVFFAVNNFLRTNIFDSAIECVLLAVLDRIVTPEQLERYKDTGEKAAPDKVDKEPAVDTPIENKDTDKVDNTQKVDSDKGEVKNEDKPLVIGGVEINTDTIHSNDFDKTTKSQVAVKDNDGKDIVAAKDNIDKESKIFGVSARNIVPSYREVGITKDDNKHNTTLTDKGDLIVKINVDRRSVDGKVPDSVFKNERNGRDISIPGGFVVREKTGSTFITNTNFEIKGVLAGSDTDKERIGSKLDIDVKSLGYSDRISIEKVQELEPTQIQSLYSSSVDKIYDYNIKDYKNDIEGKISDVENAVSVSKNKTEFTKALDEIKDLSNAVDKTSPNSSLKDKIDVVSKIDQIDNKYSGVVEKAGDSIVEKRIDDAFKDGNSDKIEKIQYEKIDKADISDRAKSEIKDVVSEIRSESKPDFVDKLDKIELKSDKEKAVATSVLKNDISNAVDFYSKAGDRTSLVALKENIEEKLDKNSDSYKEVSDNVENFKEYNDDGTISYIDHYPEGSDVPDKRDYYDADGNIEKTADIEKDENSDKCTFTIKDTDGNIESVEKHEDYRFPPFEVTNYDKDGNETSVEKYDDFGNVISDDTKTNDVETNIETNDVETNIETKESNVNDSVETNSTDDSYQKAVDDAKAEIKEILKDNIDNDDKLQSVSDKISDKIDNLDTKITDVLKDKCNENTIGEVKDVIVSAYKSIDVDYTNKSSGISKYVGEGLERNLSIGLDLRNGKAPVGDFKEAIDKFNNIESKEMKNDVSLSELKSEKVKELVSAVNNADNIDAKEALYNGFVVDINNRMSDSEIMELRPVSMEVFSSMSTTGTIPDELAQKLDDFSIQYNMDNVEVTPVYETVDIDGSYDEDYIANMPITYNSTISDFISNYDEPTATVTSENVVDSLLTSYNDQVELIDAFTSEAIVYMVNNPDNIEDIEDKTMSAIADFGDYCCYTSITFESAILACRDNDLSDDQIDRLSDKFVDTLSDIIDRSVDSVDRTEDSAETKQKIADAVDDTLSVLMPSNTDSVRTMITKKMTTACENNESVDRYSDRIADFVDNTLCPAICEFITSRDSIDVKITEFEGKIERYDFENAISDDVDHENQDVEENETDYSNDIDSSERDNE